MIKCTVHKLSPSKILYLEDSNKKIVATTIRDTQYLHKIPIKLAEVLEDNGIVYLDIDENHELQNIILSIKNFSEVKTSVYKTELSEINQLNTKIEDLSSTVDKKEKAIIRVLNIIENKFKTLHLWSTINTLWIIVLTIIILSLI